MSAKVTYRENNQIKTIIASAFDMLTIRLAVEQWVSNEHRVCGRHLIVLSITGE